MKKSLLFIFLLATAFCGYARPLSAGFVNNNVVPVRDSSQIIPTMEDMLIEITQVLGLENNFELKADDVLNIEATIFHRKKMIIYNPVFIDWINKATGNKWSTLALIAHELGHHVNGHTKQRSGSEPALELEADEFAGFVLYRMGATLKEAQEVMYFISTNQPSKTHPARNDRLMAIQKGWDRAFDERM